MPARRPPYAAARCRPRGVPAARRRARGAPPDPRRRTPTASGPGSRPATGGRSGCELADDGSQSFAAVDQRTGEAIWSDPAAGSERASGPRRRRTPYGGWCPVTRRAASRRPSAVCLVTDGFVRYDDDGAEERVPATSSRVVVFDTRDGHVIAEWAAEPTASSPSSTGSSSVGTRDAERDVVVVGHDLRSGDERWRYEAPADERRARRSAPDEFWALFAAGSTVGVYDGEDDHAALLDRDPWSGTTSGSPAAVAGSATDPVTGVVLPQHRRARR